MTAAYEFDFANRPESLTVKRAGHPDQVVASGAVYEPSGPLGDLQLGNGLTENRGWTSRYFPQDIPVNGASTIFQWLYSTDFVGNPTAITDGFNAANNRTYSYQPHQYFLTVGNGPWGGRAWNYDKIGNRVTETKGAITDTYAYTLNGAGKNTALLDAITLGATGTRDYQYGLAGHLERVTAPSNEILFTTDAAGRQARLDRAAGDAAADFTYDGRSFLQTSKAATVTEVFTDGFEGGDARCWDGEFGATLNAGTADCSPKPETTPTYSSDGLLHAVTYRPDKFTESTRYYLHFAGRPIAEVDIPAGGGAGTYLWLTTDHLGTPVIATDAAGTAVWEGGFEPFGQDWSGASMAGIDLRFPGQWMDDSWQDASEGARGYYNVYRWYEAGVGRYGKVDPLGLRGGPHAFSYAVGNPISGLDPLGLKVELYCHPVGAGGDKPLHRAAGRAGFGHCFVRIKCDNCEAPGGSYDRRLELTGRNNETGAGEIPTNPADFSFGHNASVVPFSPSDWTSQDCQTEQCIQNRYDELGKQGFEYGSPPMGWLFGPNSNTFAEDLLRSCGITTVHWPEGITGVQRPSE